MLHDLFKLALKLKGPVYKISFPHTKIEVASLVLALLFERLCQNTQHCSYSLFLAGNLTYYWPIALISDE